MDRRGFIAAAGTVLGAGCSSALPSGSTPTPTPSPTETPTPTRTPTPELRQARSPGFDPADDPYAEEYGRSGGLELAPGEFMAFSFGSDNPVRLRYAFDVIEGGSIDVLTMRADAFVAYREGADRIRFYDGASATGTDRGQVSSRLPAGDHVLVFDNTRLGAAKPSGTVRLRFGMAVGRPSTPTPVPTATPFPFVEARTPAFTPDENPYADGYARSGGLALDRGEFVSFVVQNEDAFTFRYGFEVVEGEPIDALLMGGQAFDNYLDERPAGYYADASVGGSMGNEVSVRLPGGEHALVFDNTYAGLAEPTGSSRIVFGFGFGSGDSS